MAVIGKKTTVPLDTVVLSTDFGLAAYKASRYAMMIAQHFGAKLEVAHAFTLAEAAMTVEVETARAKESEQRRSLKAHLTRLTSELRAGDGEAQSLLLEGDPVEQITKLGERRSPSLIVMGTHGGNALARRILGSVAEGVLRSAATPVLTVGPQVVASSLGEPSFRYILFATDCTLESAHAARYAVAFAEAFGIRIETMNVARERDMQDEERLREVNECLYEAFSKVVPDQARDLCGPGTFIDGQSAKDSILAKARQVSADLIILGVKKNSHPAMHLRTSFAFQLVIEADCPVLTVASDPA